MPKIFGFEHILYLVLQALVAIPLVWWALKKAKSNGTQTLIVRILGGVLLIAVLVNRVAIAFHRETWTGLIPDSFCGTCNLLLAVFMLIGKRESLAFHCLTYLCIVGGLLNLIYPTYITQDSSFWYPATTTGLFHHTLAVYAVVLLFGFGFWHPTLKKCYALPVGLCIVMSYGIFLIDAFDIEGAMFIHKPLVEGTILTWYFVGAIMIAVASLFMWACDKFRHK